MRNARVWALTALMGLATATAGAAEPEQVKQEAKDLFHGGARAYAVGQFEQAVKYLDAAYALSPQPAILFSLSQALRRQYARDRNPATLARALAGFRQYLAEVPHGARVKDAAEAVAELELLSRSQEPEGELTGVPAAPDQAAELIVTSGTDGALIEVDGKAQRDDDGQPILEFWSGRLAAGEHSILVTAQGYFEVSRTIRLAAGRPHAVDIVLTQRPAQLQVDTRSGTRIQIDGRVVAETPFARPIEVTPGTHVVTLLKNGHQASSHELKLAPGQSTTLSRALPVTTQRKISYVLAGAGAVSVITSALFAGAAVERQRHASLLLTQRADGELSQAQAEEYEAARQARFTHRTTSIVALGAGMSMLSLSAVLYLFDQPSTPLRLGKVRPAVGPKSFGLTGSF